MKLYNFDNFPFFYVPKGDFELTNLNEIVNVYTPKKIDACWSTKTPCTGETDKIYAKKIFGFNVFLDKDK